MTGVNSFALFFQVSVLNVDVQILDDGLDEMDAMIWQSIEAKRGEALGKEVNMYASDTVK